MSKLGSRSRAWCAPASCLALTLLSGCATLGSVLSPYSEKFSCKNSDHGQCIHPEQAYADAVAGRASKSDPAVTNDKKLLTKEDRADARRKDKKREKDKLAGAKGRPEVAAAPNAYAGLAASVADAGTPMLRPSRTVRTLILPYADRQRPDRLYMSRFVYSMLGQPAWVVGSYLVEPAGRAPNPPVLRSVRDTGAETGEASAPIGAEPRP
ncbi:TraV family lipoprotein [Sphingomonas sp. H39-1-10]|uniref:TraV family lipoprotein n=1 Tax=Sphingomonas pollutisoli TaxID=3030829 RepID=UPI0023B916C5|nr:TraV family lipoprotein [Sphingomonas pollutisoli]MDF0487724.1 TraV family lipoprotein [Sphingomonas pollutisoli]